MSVKSYLSHAVAKPLFAGLAASAADHFIMKNKDTKANAYFGASVASGILAVSWLEPLVSPMMPTHTPLSALGKGLEGRIIEIAAGSLSSYAINLYIFKNNYTKKDLLMKLGIVAASDLIGETVCEFLCIV